MATSKISKRRKMMDEEDVGATPRVLRVVNPSLGEESGSISSRVVSQHSRTFSFRSFSGSVSSLWRRHDSTSTSRSRHSCIPFSMSSRSPPSPTASPSPRYYMRHPIGEDYNITDEIGGSQRPNPLQPPPLRLPAVASLKVTTSSFVVGEDVSSKPCAYVIIDMTCWPQNALQEHLRVCQRASPGSQLDNDPGHLDGLQIAISIDGPASTLFEVGASQCPTLRLNGRWVVVAKLGLKENNLAVKSSNSVRSRSGTSTSLSLIDQFLHRLEADSKRSEPVFVRAVIRGRHAFLPENTTLETGAVCCVGSLTTTSSTTTLAKSELQTSIIHALDPGLGHFISLTSVTRPERQLCIDFPANEAMTLIEDFRLVFGNAIHRSVDVDLAKLEAYYYYKANTAATPVKASTLRRSLNHVRNAMSKLSLKKKNVE